MNNEIFFQIIFTEKHFLLKKNSLNNPLTDESRHLIGEKKINRIE